MIIRHHLAADRIDRQAGRVVKRAWCQCGQPFIAVGRTRKKADRKCRRAFRDHRGFARAAGPCFSAECDC